MSSTEQLSDEESLPSGNETDNKHGYLIVDDKWHEITVGETKIGRDSSVCSIVLGDATISVLHAVIESEGPEDSFIYDANSSNKTKIGKMTLKPQCRYKINNNDTILMGNKIFQYRVIDHRVEGCKTESSSKILKLCKSDGKTNITVLDKTSANAFDIDGKFILNTGEQGKNSHALEKSLFVSEKISNKPKEPYYILASELFNTDIFSQVTQCEIKNVQSENIKTKNKELVGSYDDIHSMKAECDYFAGNNKAESELKFYRGSTENIKKITESYFDDSGTFDFVNRNESKHFLSSSLCKSISDDIFELPTQCQSKINNSQKVLSDKDQNFKNCFSSKLFKSEKSGEGFVSAVKTESENNSCKTKTENLNSCDFISEFFDEDKDEEICEVMRAISPGINENNDRILNPRKRLIENNKLKDSCVPDEIFEIQTQFGLDLSNNKNVNESKNETLDLGRNENEKSEINQKYEKENKLTKIEEPLKNSVETRTLMTQKINIRNTKCASKKKLKKRAGETMNNRRVNTDDNISTFDVEDVEETTKNSGVYLSNRMYSLNSDNACDDRVTEQSIRGKSVLSNDVFSDVPNDGSESDFEIRLSREDSNKKGEKIKSPLVNETLNELWEKQLNCSPVSSNKTLSDLDISELQGDGITVLESDTEEDFIATQGMHLLNKSNSEKLDSEIETAIKKTKCKLDIWKEHWQDFVFTQHFADEKRRKSESESTDKTESDIVVSTKPIPNIEHYEINETSSEEGIFNIEDNSNESECLIKKKIVDESSSSGDVGHAEEDFDEFKCESPVLLHSDIQTENIQDEGERNSIKSAEEDVKKEYEPNEIRLGSDSDETDCEEELKTRLKLSFIRKIPDFDNNQRGEEIFPSTSDLKEKGKKSGDAKQITNENIFFEKREYSPLKRTGRGDTDTVLPKKRSKNIRKKKESYDVGGRQLRSRSMKACRERLQSGDWKENNEVKGSSKKRVVNTKVAPRKKLDFVLEKSSNENDRSESISSESKWKSSSVKIVFTGFESESHSRIISKLGGLRVNDFDEGNVLVTDKVRRTVKFLSAVALGLPIVSPKWLLSSNKELKFLNPWDFLLEDEASEERWGFSLKTSLEKWKKDKLLEGFNVFATKNTKPPVPEILSIVKCCGGVAFTSYPEIWPEKSIVLTCLEDKKSWPHYKNRNVKIVHYEFLLSGVLKHVIDFKTYKLR